MFWFGLVALIAAFARPAGAKTSPAAAYVFALATIGLAVMLYLAYASFFMLKTGCVLCIGTYVAVIGIFIVSGLGCVSLHEQLPLALIVIWVRRRPPRRSLASCSSLLAPASRRGVLPARECDGGPQTPAAATGHRRAATRTPTGVCATAWAQQPRVDLGIPAAPAKVIVVKFNDCQCPSCRRRT